MPPPKDPTALARYRETMRTIALERNYGKWMIGKSPTNKTRAKLSKIMQARATPEYREILTQRAIANGYGKWMIGRIGSPQVREANQRRTGKTYQDLYGNRAQTEIDKRKHGNRIRHIGKRKADTRAKHGDTFEYTEWRNAVFKRDSFVCQHCFWKVYLHAHHIKPWAKFPELRFTISNGISLCVPCHRAEHASTKKGTRS